MGRDVLIQEQSRAIKLKATAILAQVSQMERKYMAGDPNMQPHLIDIHVYIGKYLSYGYTIEPHLLTTAEALYGYDIKRMRYMTVKWEDLLDISLNSMGYNPVDAEEWENRIRETNLLYNDENVIRQSKGKFR